jgi:hypothetical protein
MRPKKHETTGSNDLFRARLDQIINMKHELVQLAGKIDWGWLDSEIAPLYSDKGRPGIETRFVRGLLLLKHIYGLSDEGVCERWVHDPYFQYFTGEAITWSVHSRRINPISLSAKPFCQGEPRAIGLSRIPMARNRRMTAVIQTRSRRASRTITRAGRSQ